MRMRIGQRWRGVIAVLLLGVGVAAAAADIAVPEGIEPDALTPLEGEALRRARQTLDQVDAQLPPLELFTETSDAPASPAAPPLAAQRAYAQARQAYREGKAFEAVRKLLIARRHAPDAPRIAQMLGRVYTEAGNKVRGAQFLEEAAAIDPDHLPTIFLLGRYALERSQWDRAIALLRRAQRLDARTGATDADPARRVLLHFHLAVALQRAGYLDAAREQYRAYLDADRRVARVTPRLRELAFIDQSRDATWMTLGDLLHQLGRPKQALDAYRRAADQADQPRVELGLRRVYTLLRLGRADGAEAYVIDRVRSGGMGDDALPLVRYYLSEAESTALVGQLETLYEQEDRSPQMAIAIADLLPADAARAMLLRHLSRRPTDHDVFAHLLGKLTPADDADPDRREEATVQLVRLTAEASAAAPGEARAYRRVLAQAVDNPRRIADACGRLIEGQPPEAEPYVRYIRGAALRQLGHYAEAGAALDAALDAEPKAPVIRIERARVLVAQQQYDRAAKMLEGDWPEGNTDVLLLRATVLAEAGQVESALELIRAQAPDRTDPPVAIARARLLRMAGQDEQARRVLQDAINAHPTEESLYASLLDDYRERIERGEDGYTEPMQALMRRLLTTLPASRTARLLEAELRMGANEIDDSERILTKLLEKNPRDLRALELMFQLYLRSDRRDKAIETRERWLLAKPQGIERTVELVQFYDSLDRHAEAVAHLKRAIRRPGIEEPGHVANLLWVMMRRQDPDSGPEAQRLLDEAVDRFPAHASDIRYQQAGLWSAMGQPQRHKRVLEKILEEDPGHAPANNDLGYSLAEQGRELDRAGQMIERALAQDPNSSHYLDSMGWVRYKQGAFEQAVDWLRKAVDAPRGQHPIILDHLGDALFRLGDKAQAVANWGKAKTLMEQPEHANVTEYAGLADQLDEKIKAARADQPPPLAPVP